MRLSEQKINHTTVLVIKGLQSKNLVEFKDETAALKVMREVITEYLKLDEKFDAEARRKILAHMRTIPEGSEEWKILYKKYYNEAKARKKL